MYVYVCIHMYIHTRTHPDIYTYRYVSKFILNLSYIRFSHKVKTHRNRIDKKG